MRLLVTAAGGWGHVAPMLPVARAATALGHAVAVAVRPALVDVVAAAGLTPLATGDPALDPAPLPSGRRPPLRPIDPEAEDRVLVEGFAGVVARDRAAAMAAQFAAWRPDVVLADEVDFGAVVAAEAAGVPHATSVSMPAGTFVRPALLADAVGALRAGHRLEADPDLHRTAGALVLVPAPPSFRDPGAPLPPVARFVRPADPEPGAAAPAAVPTAAAPGGRPLIYASLGTAFTQEAGDLYERVVAAGRDLPADLLLTVGRDLDPVELGPLPANVRVERYVPQWAVLARAAVAVTHGGSGGVIGALAHGVPVVALPLGADQPSNSARIEALGAGRVLDALTARPEDLAATVTALLGDVPERVAAAALRDECAALPPPAAAVDDLVALAGGGVAR